MKKVMLVITVILCTVLANAQISLGLKAGLNFSTLGGDDADLPGKKSNTGYNFGVLAGIPLSTNFVFQPEIMFSANQGMEFRPNSTSETNYNLNYINIPLMFKYKSMGFYGEAGPYIGLLTSGMIKTKTSTSSSETDIKDSFDDSDLGVALGTGYVMKSGLGFGVRYNMGLKNIHNSTTTELKNRYWQVNLIYMLAKKIK